LAHNLASLLAHRDKNMPDVILSLAANTPMALGIKDSITARRRQTLPSVALTHRPAPNAIRS
jgi:hypothetical protein